MIGNQGFSSGRHYWEIICPGSSSGVQVGIIKEGWNLSLPIQNAVNTGLFFNPSFKSTQSRTYGILLNIQDKTIQFYVNGSLQAGKIMNLPPSQQKNTVYYPAIKIKETGSQAIINDAAVEPTS